jgi:hypothetical protein
MPICDRFKAQPSTNCETPLFNFTSLVSAAAFCFTGKLANADSNAKAALQDYDPVGFFRDHKPVKGNPTYDGSESLGPMKVIVACGTQVAKSL